MKKNTISNNKIKGNNFILVVTALLIIAAVLIGSTISGFAGTKDVINEKSCNKYYTSIVIEDGDTLWKIASEYMDMEYTSLKYNSVQEYINEIRSLNHLVDDKITAGEYLTVPYYSLEIL